MALTVFLECFMEQDYLAHLSQCIWPGFTFFIPLTVPNFLHLFIFSWCSPLFVLDGTMWVYFHLYGL